MRYIHYLTVLLFSLFSLGAICQTPNIVYRVEQGFSGKGEGIQLLPNGSFRIFNMINYTGYSTSYMSETFDAEGVFLYRNHHLGAEIGGNFVKLDLKDGSAIVACSHDGCDYIASPELLRLSPHGTNTWYFDPLYLDLIGEKFRMFQVSKSEFVLSGTSNNFFDFNGNKVNGPDTYIAYTELIHTPTGYIMIEDSILYVLDGDFEVISNKQFDSELLTVRYMENGILVLSKEMLYILDNEFSVIQSYDSPSIFNDYPDIDKHSYNIIPLPSGYLIHAYWHYRIMPGGYTFEGSRLYLLSEEMELLDKPSQSFTIRDVKLAGEHLYFSGTGPGIDQQAVYAKTDLKDFNLSIEQDIGISSIRIPGEITADYYDHPWRPEYRNINYGEVFVTITNFGKSEINRAEIHFDEIGCLDICLNKLQEQWIFNDLGLLPGDSVEVSLGELFIFCGNFDIYNFCVYTNGVDDKPDGNSLNDMACITLDVTTAVDQIKEPNYNISIYPNPASNELHVQLHDLDIDSYSINLFDIYGKRVLSFDLQLNESVLDVSSVVPGVYFLSIDSPGNVHKREKVIIHSQ